jgi:hypothetical protein
VGATSVHETYEPPIETPDTPRTKKAKYIQRTLDEGYSRIQQANYHDSLLHEAHVAHSTPARPRVIPRIPKPTLVLPMLDATYFRSQPATDPNATSTSHETFYLELLREGIDNATAISCTEECIKRHSLPLAKHKTVEETLAAKSASTASVVNSNGTEPFIVYSHHSYTELAASSSDHIFFDNCANPCTIIDRALITSSAERDGHKIP